MQIQASRRLRGILVAVSVSFYAVLCFVLLLKMLRNDNGHLFFSLDDPYIHLALAEQISHGHYGINPGEPSSPSSSILWPLLLAPFSGATWQPLVALGLNLLAGLGLAAMFGSIVASWPGFVGSREEHWRRFISVVALVVIGNLAGLAFIGMEHSLQVLLAVISAMGFIFCLRGRRIPWWCLVVVAIAPMVRYENLGLSLGIAIALVGQRSYRIASALLIASVAPLIGFGIFLHHLGLPALPLSVLNKGNVPVGNISLLRGGINLLRSIVFNTAGDTDRYVLALLFFTLCGLAWFERERVRRFALMGASTAAGLHLIVGRFNWFHRYEMYIVVASLLVVLQVIHERPRVLLGFYAMGLLACCYAGIDAIERTPMLSKSVYLQQEQMHRFVTEFYTGNSVAVNDLGIVSYRRRAGLQVLDLVGLGSVEAARQGDKSAPWLDQITREHHVDLVMIYPEWFSQLPNDWVVLGTLCDGTSVLPNRCVSYFATPWANQPLLTKEFQTFVTTVPDGVKVR